MLHSRWGLNPHFLRNTICTFNEHPATGDSGSAPMTEKTGSSRDVIFPVGAKSSPDTHVTQWRAAGHVNGLTSPDEFFIHQDAGAKPRPPMFYPRHPRGPVGRAGHVGGRPNPENFSYTRIPAPNPSFFTSSRSLILDSRL